VLGELQRGELNVVRGSVTFVPITNPLAYTLKRRAGDRNLNRNLRPNDAPQDYEDRIANVLCPLLAAHDVLLDLHSFHTGGEPFAMLGPQDNDGPLEAFAHAAAEEALALRLGARRLVEGWLDTYATGVRRRLARTAPTERAHLLSTDPDYGIGTTEYMRRMGGYAVTLECGQHEDPAAPEFAWRAIRNTLAHLQLVDAAAPAARDSIELLRLTEVIDRLHADDSFARPWCSFDAVRAGERIGSRHDGTRSHRAARRLHRVPESRRDAGQRMVLFRTAQRTGARCCTGTDFRSASADWRSHCVPASGSRLPKRRWSNTPCRTHC
jgi:predicted deacylase